MQQPPKNPAIQVLTAEQIESLRQEMQQDGEAMRQLLNKKQPVKQHKPA